MSIKPGYKPCLVKAAVQDSVRPPAMAGGFVMILMAKVVFIATVYLVQLLLPRILPDATEFGRFSAAMNLIAVTTNVIALSCVQTLSRRLSGLADGAPEVSFELRRALRAQVPLAFALGGSWFLLAPFIAGTVLLDPQLTPSLQASALVITGYALYASYPGFLNGQRWFAKQARLDSFFSVLRAILIISAAWWSAQAAVAILGLGTSAMSAAVIALFLFGVGKSAAKGSEGLPYRSLKPWFAFFVPLAVYQLALNGMFQLDLAVLKRNVASLGLSSGLSPTVSADEASRYAAYYRAAQTFAFVPYQLVVSIVTVLFPHVARLAQAGDARGTRATVRHGLRVTTLLSFSVAAPIAGSAHNVMRLAYPAEYAAGAPALGILTYGLAIFCIFAVAATVCNSLGKPLLAACLAGFALCLVIVFGSVLTFRAGLGIGVLAAASTGTLLAMLLSTVMIAVVLLRLVGTFVPLGTLLRVALASSCTSFLCSFAPQGDSPLDATLWACVQLGLGFCFYGAVLVFVREIKRSELESLAKSLRSLLARKRFPAKPNGGAKSV